MHDLLLPITALYGGLAALIYTGLTIAVVMRRKTLSVALGDGGDPVLYARIRAHGNFLEYTLPLLLALLVGEAYGAPAWALHSFGVTLLVGRILHALSLIVIERQNPANTSLRVMGMIITMTLLALTSFCGIVTFVVYTLL